MLNEFNYSVISVWYYGQDIYELITTLDIFGSDNSNSFILENLRSLIPDLQEVIDKNELSDEILLVAEKQ